MNENDFLFSIIVPIYKTEKYLKKCLDSIMLAIDTDCEVILVNDGSPDNSEKIIENFMKKLPKKYRKNFFYIKKDNKGLADTKNVGIASARGKYISVIDSDDYISENFYKDARSYIENGYDIIIYDLYVIFENNPKYNYISRAIREDKDNFISQIMHGAMLGSSCNKIIKKSLYKYSFPIGKEYEDVAVTPFILLDAKKIKYISNPNYYYLQRKRSIVANNSLDNAFYKICENVTDVISKENKPEKYYEIINVFFIDRTIDMLDLSLKNSRKTLKNKLTKFYDNNKFTIELIIKNKIIIFEETYLTNRQSVLLEKIYLCLQEKKYNKIVRLLILRRYINWNRAIIETLKHLFKIILGGIYYE